MPSTYVQGDHGESNKGYAMHFSNDASMLPSIVPKATCT